MIQTEICVACGRRFDNHTLAEARTCLANLHDVYWLKARLEKRLSEYIARRNAENPAADSGLEQ